MVNKVNENQEFLEQDFPLRSPDVVMDINRLGSMHQSRLSFMRQLMRRVMREQWQIDAAITDLDEHGYGTQVYTIKTPNHIYSHVIFSDYLADEDRNDRVIAEKWDVTMALCIGTVSSEQLEIMRRNVPKQEAGRASSNMMVLSRGNKSSRNFNYVVDELAAGRQPQKSALAKVGYLYRTTAVYGSGKFGLADWAKVKQQCPEFASPFAAEMFCCYMLRHFSIQQAEHLARIKAPKKAVALADDIKRFIGIGNSTGLGMAPYLIRHPKLISQWVLTREKALARVINRGAVNKNSCARLGQVLDKAILHIQETTVPDEIQIKRNQVLEQELSMLLKYLQQDLPSNWHNLVAKAEQEFSLETQEMLNSALLEVHPELVDGYAQYESVDEQYIAQPNMSLQDFLALIEQHYRWALSYDFSQQGANHYFWYRSEEKMEPRIGERFNEPGQEREMPLTIARLVRECYDSVIDYCANKKTNNITTAKFLIDNPAMASIVKRIQSMSQECYGEIRGNLADIEMRPLDLLRCKLSFFGVSKFDPKSKLWVRNTMFQGAPVISDIGQTFADDWYFPVAGSASSADELSNASITE